MGTRVHELGLESDSSLDFVGLGLESYTSELGLDSRHACGPGLDSGTRTGLGKRAAELKI